MERLMVLHLDALDCEAEASLNGVPLARVSPARPSAVVAVHEYALAGANALELVVWPLPAVLPPGEPLPPPRPLVATGKQSAHLRLLLPRMGQPADPAAARSLAQLDWAPAEGARFEAPMLMRESVELPLSFPRWRWLEAPPVQPTPALRSAALAFVQQLATSLAQGDCAPFMAATRLRTEELSVAYQNDPAQEAQRLQQHLLQAHEAQQFQWLPLDEASFALRPIAQGRLLECLDVGGEAFLRTQPDAQGRSLALPLRLAAVDNRFYVLR